MTRKLTPAILNRALKNGQVSYHAYPSTESVDPVTARKLIQRVVNEPHEEVDLSFAFDSDTETKQQKTDTKNEIKFCPVRSKVTLDLRPEVFKESDAFATMMEKAHQDAIRLNPTYGTQAINKTKGKNMSAVKLSEKEIKIRDLQEKRKLYRALGLNKKGQLKYTPAEKRVQTLLKVSKLNLTR